MLVAQAAKDIARGRSGCLRIRFSEGCRNNSVAEDTP
jgi:hypothetical protein